MVGTARGSLFALLVAVVLPSFSSSVSSIISLISISSIGGGMICSSGIHWFFSVALLSLALLSYSSASIPAV